MDESQIQDEKHAIQKLLLNFEKHHGRPVSTITMLRVLFTLIRTFSLLTAKPCGQRDHASTLWQVPCGQADMQHVWRRRWEGARELLCLSLPSCVSYRTGLYSRHSPFRHPLTVLLQYSKQKVFARYIVCFPPISTYPIGSNFVSWIIMVLLPVQIIIGPWALKKQVAFE